MRPSEYVLSIAGFDPSSGAGVTSDVKTFESLGVYGLSICTAITIQDESRFEKCYWLEEEKIFEQLNLILAKYKPNYIKVGIIESFTLLEKIVDRIVELNPKAKIIWDPVLKSSSGFVFHRDWSETRLRFLLNKMHLITPNYSEWLTIAGDEDWKEAADQWVLHCNLFIKSVDNGDGSISDYLITETESKKYSSNKINSPKHGSGCVLSSAICSKLAIGHTLEEACAFGRAYCLTFLKSDTGLLGKHASE